MKAYFPAHISAPLGFYQTCPGAVPHVPILHPHDGLISVPLIPAHFSAARDFISEFDSTAAELVPPASDGEEMQVKLTDDGFRNWYLCCHGETEGGGTLGFFGQRVTTPAGLRPSGNFVEYELGPGEQSFHVRIGKHHHSSPNGVRHELFISPPGDEIPSYGLVVFNLGLERFLELIKCPPDLNRILAALTAVNLWKGRWPSPPVYMDRLVFRREKAAAIVLKESKLGIFSLPLRVVQRSVEDFSMGSLMMFQMGMEDPPRKVPFMGLWIEGESVGLWQYHPLTDQPVNFSTFFVSLWRAVEESLMDVPADEPLIAARNGDQRPSLRILSLSEEGE